MNITKEVNEFKTNHPIGFTSLEIDLLLMDKFPTVKREEFNEKMGVVTAALIDNMTRYYHCDVELAIRCCLEKRNPTISEFD